MVTVRQQLFLVALTLLGGCASSVPETIRNVPPQDVPIETARREPEKHRGATVRWGGSIVSVRNLKEETQIEVVGRQLDRNGRPRAEDRSEGRFLAKASGFYDPAVYAAGREVTMTGRVEGVAAQTIGEFPYRYPVVRAEQVYLWPPRPPPPQYPDYDPFWYDPWYPWGHPFWPYYRPRY